MVKQRRNIHAFVVAKFHDKYMKGPINYLTKKEPSI